MQYTDICLITEDVPRLARFYEALFGVAGEGDAIHTALVVGGTGLVLYDKTAARRDMGYDFSQYNGTGCLVLSFNVADVDAEYQRLKAMDVVFVTTPTTWPWGARAMHFRDPDGNMIGFRTLPKP